LTNVLKKSPLKINFFTLKFINFFTNFFENASILYEIQGFCISFNIFLLLSIQYFQLLQIKNKFDKVINNLNNFQGYNEGL
jgi:hypothetical protein